MFPGNAGTSLIAQNIEADLNNFEELKKLIRKLNIDLIIVGPEKPLVDGLADYLEENKIKVFGQTKLLLNLRDQRYFKKIMRKIQYSTANFGVFENVTKSLSFLNSANFL